MKILEKIMVTVLPIEMVWLITKGGYWQATLLAVMVGLMLYSMHLDRVIERLKRELGES